LLRTVIARRVAEQSVLVHAMSLLDAITSNP